MITTFITYLRSIRNYSENTCIAYEKDLRLFAKMIKQIDQEKRWSTINRNDIDKIIILLSSQNKKPSTTNRLLSSVSGFYNYLKRSGYNIENPCRYESRRKITRSVPNTIAYNELKEAYNKASIATKVMLGLLITTGIRIQELLNLKWEDINFEKNSLKIHGKGNKERIVYTNHQQLETLLTVKITSNPTGIIFTINQRQARKMIYEALKPYCKASQLSPHAIRHTFATYLAEKGVNCSTLSNILGHNQLNTTQKYIDMNKTKLESINNYSLLNN